mgnify:CR=1 FL=1
MNTQNNPIELLSHATLIRLLEIRPDLRNDVVKELKRRGVQVVEDGKT